MTTTADVTASPPGDALASLECPPLRRLSLDERRALEHFMTRREFAPGASLCTFTEPPDGLFFITRGEVSVTLRPSRSAKQIVYALGRGGVLGAAALVGTHPTGVAAVAVGPVQALVLPRARIPAAVDAVPALRAALDALAEVRIHQADILAAMRRSALLYHIPTRFLATLIHGAEVRSVAAGDVVLRQGDPPSGAYFVVTGALHQLRADASTAEDSHGELVDTLHPGDLFGDVALVTGRPQATTVVATSAARLVVIHADFYRKLLEDSTAFRRSVRAIPTLHEQIAAATRAADDAHQETLLVYASAPAPVAALTELLAQHLVAEHRDRVLVARLEPAPEGETPRPPPEPAWDPETGVAHIHLRAPEGPNGAAVVGLALASHSARFDYVLLDAAAYGRGDALRFCGLTSKVTLLADAGTPAPPVDERFGCKVIHAVLLDPSRPRTSEPAYPRGAVRLRRSLLRLRGRAVQDVRLGDLEAGERAALGRWARALSDRRVGIALGGGGAWGFAHIALIRAVLDHKVPIDMVSGASVGATVGAYFAARDLAGLALLESRGAALDRAVMRSIVSSKAIQRFVDHDLGAVRLEHLEVPFFPIATEVATRTPRAITVGTVGHGVRASGSFPLFFTPTTEKGARFVDGGIIDNVPSSVLADEGASLLVASNVISLPPAETPREPRIPGAFGRFVHEFNPAARLKDALRSAFILMHAAGDADAFTADVLYESDPVPVLPWDFEAGGEVIARSNDGAHRAVDEIVARWRRLGGRGGDR